MFDDTVVTVWSAPNYCYRYDFFQASGGVLGGAGEMWEWDFEWEWERHSLTHSLTHSPDHPLTPWHVYSCGNVASILELDEHLEKNWKIFEAAPPDQRGVPAKKPTPDYFL